MKINCPQCDQEFDVSKDLLGSKVECGCCDHKFTIEKDGATKTDEKHYPGEKKKKGLSKFDKKIPGKSSEVAFTSVNYESDVDPELIGPPRRRKTLASIAGFSLICIVVLVFLLIGGKEGPMRDVETPNRFVLCGFCALLASALMIYGSSRRRWLGVLVSLIMSGVVISMPVLFPGNPVSSFITPIDVPVAPVTEPKVEIEPESIQDYLIRIGHDPVEEALLDYSEESVVGIYVRNASYNMQAKIASYLYYATGRVSREVLFPRGETGNAALILLTEQKKSFEQIAALCERFGEIVRKEKNFRLIEVIADPSVAGDELDAAALNDPEHAEFEVVNLRVLQNIDPMDQLAAVKRLAAAKPGELRDQMTDQLSGMLRGSHSELQLEIINALKVWAKPEADIGGNVLEAVKSLHEEQKVSPLCMDLLIARKVEGSEVILMELWSDDPAGWADTVKKLGAGAELMLLPEIAGMSAEQVISASDILGEVGTRDCLEYLKEFLSKSKLDAKKTKSLQAAIDEIKKRS